MVNYKLAKQEENPFLTHILSAFLDSQGEMWKLCEQLTEKVFVNRSTMGLTYSSIKGGEGIYLHSMA